MKRKRSEKKIIGKIQAFIKIHWLFLLILFAAAFLRFYRLNQMSAHDFDQEYATNFVYDVVYEYPIRLIGQGLSVQGLFMGPWFFYFLVPFYGLTGWTPVGGFVASVLLGLATITAYYAIGWKLFSKKVGLLAASLRAFTFYTISSDWSITPAFSSDLLVIIFWYLLFMLWKKKSWALPAIALTVGMFTSFHPIHFPLGIVLAILLWWWKFKASLKIWLISLGLFILPSTPLLLFDYLRKWTMVKNLLSLLNGSSSSQLNLERLWVIIVMIVDFFEELLRFSQQSLWTGVVGILIFIFLLSRMIIKKKVPAPFFHKSSLITTFVVVTAYYFFYPNNIPSYYLGSLRNLFYLYVPVVLVYLYQLSRTGKSIVILIVSYVLISNGVLILDRLSHPDLLASYYHKQQIVDKIIDEVGEDTDFAISYIAHPGRNVGFQSLFRLKGYKSGSPGSIYTIVLPKNQFPDNSYGFISGDIGIIYPEEN